MNSTVAVKESGIGPSVGKRAAGAGLLSLILLSLGHFSVDLYSSALGALQPLLVEKLGFTLTGAGILGGALIFSSSLMQPVYGLLSDRFHTRVFVVLSPAIAGIFISLLGVAPSFGWLLVLVVVGGAGVASFHPQASSRATLGLEHARGRFMAIFISCGTLGFAVGPSYFSAVTDTLGMGRLYWAAVPGVLASLLMFMLLPHSAPPHAPARRHFDWEPFRAVWKPITILYLLVIIRSVLQVTYAQFLPLYLHLERGFPVSTANHTLSIYLLAGAAGGFMGGNLLDKFGGRNVILVSMIASVPFLALFFFSQGVVSVLGLWIGGLLLFLTIPVNVVMAQQLVPSQTGTVSALLMGFAWGTAGLIFVPFTGWAADLFSLQTVLSTLVIFPVIGFALAWTLPKR